MGACKGGDDGDDGDEDDDDDDGDDDDDDDDGDDYDDDGDDRLEICQKIYRTEDFRVKNLHRKRVIFDIC